MQFFCPQNLFAFLFNIWTGMKGSKYTAIGPILARLGPARHEMVPNGLWLRKARGLGLDRPPTPIARRTFCTTGRASVGPHIWTPTEPMTEGEALAALTISLFSPGAIVFAIRQIITI